MSQCRCVQGRLFPLEMSLSISLLEGCFCATLFLGRGMGKSLGTAMTDVLAHPNSAAGCSVSFLAPSCQETSACPKQTTLQIPPVILPKPSVLFIPDPEHPCACIPSPGELLPAYPVVLQWVLLLLNPRGSGGIEGSVHPALGWRDPPVPGDSLGQRNSC